MTLVKTRRSVEMPLVKTRRFGEMFHVKVRRPGGMTMVEIMVVLGLAGLVIWVFSSVFSGATRTGGAAMTREAFATWSRTVFARLGKDVRSARSVGLDGTTIEMEILGEDQSGAVKARKICYVTGQDCIVRIDGGVRRPVAGRFGGGATPLRTGVETTGSVAGDTEHSTGGPVGSAPDAFGHETGAVEVGAGALGHGDSVVGLSASIEGSFLEVTLRLAPGRNGSGETMEETSRFKVPGSTRRGPGNRSR